MTQNTPTNSHWYRPKASAYVHAQQAKRIDKDGCETQVFEDDPLAEIKEQIVDIWSYLDKKEIEDSIARENQNARLATIERFINSKPLQDLRWPDDEAGYSQGEVLYPQCD